MLLIKTFILELRKDKRSLTSVTSARFIAQERALVEWSQLRLLWRGAKQMAAFWCFCKESTSLHVTTRTDIYSGFLLVLYNNTIIFFNNITSFLNITIFFLYSTSIILIVYTWYSITCSCFTRVLVIALAFTCLLYSFAWYSTCCFALFILLDIRSCRVSFLWLRSAPLHVFGKRRREDSICS